MSFSTFNSNSNKDAASAMVSISIQLEDNPLDDKTKTAYISYSFVDLFYSIHYLRIFLSKTHHFPDHYILMMNFGVLRCGWSSSPDYYLPNTSITSFLFMLSAPSIYTNLNISGVDQIARNVSTSVQHVNQTTHGK